MITFQDLYTERCYQTSEGLKPHFWKPQEFAYSQPSLMADENRPLYSVDRVISKTIALGLCLEIPVGEFVLEATKKDLPDDPFVKKLLKTNITDEAAHFKGFTFASNVYPVHRDHLLQAKEFEQIWCALGYHPISIAAHLETAVFLITLGGLRLFGGKNLCNMASQIARDERRHVAANRGVVKALSLEFNAKLKPLIELTLDWVFDDLNIAKSETGIAINKDFMIKSGIELFETGQAKKLNNLVNFVSHDLPFENSNASLYSREIEV
jgi:hypothetical protein